MNISFTETSQFSDDALAELAGKVAAIDPWLKLGYSQSHLHYRLSHPDCDSRHLVIVDGDRPVGAICLKYPWLYGVYIGLFAIVPEAQGQGIGSLALEYIENEYCSQARSLWLLVSDFNQTAQDFYLSRGFKIIGNIEDFLVEGEDEVLMRKKILQVEEGI